MDEERAPVKAKKFVVKGLKKIGRSKKRWKEVVVEKDMLVRELKRTDAQDRSLWRLDCKSQFASACGEKPGSSRMKRFVSTLGING